MYPEYVSCFQDDRLTNASPLKASIVMAQKINK